MPKGFPKGLVRDAKTAKVAAQVNQLLRECDQAAYEHWHRCHCGYYGDYSENWWLRGLELDLSAIRGRLRMVQRLVCGVEVEPEKQGESK